VRSEGPVKAMSLNNVQTKPASGTPQERLDSWKEIAAYLKRGARTVQRWEREEGLPVHRLQHDKLGSVYAYRSELDAWWASRGQQLKEEAPAGEKPEASVAVLPFSDLSREKDQEYFCDGVAAELVAALSKIQGLRVASRTSALRFKGGDTPASEIGRQLRVGTLLEGSVRRSADRLRIAVQLADTESGYTLWSETYDRDMSDVFSIQEEIARSVAQTLELTLTAKEKAALEKPPTKSVAAYDYYLRGWKFYYQYGPNDMQCAIQLFVRAISLDPGYPLAYAGLADCWSYIYLYSQRRDEVRQQAEWASQHAVELDPECAQAQASRGLALSLCRRDAEAGKSFDAAIQLDANLFEAYYFYARHCFVCGQFEKAVQLYEQAIRVRPEDYQSPLLMAQIYDDLGRHDAARAARVRGINLAEEHLKLNPDDARAVYMAANGMAALGQTEQGRQWADRALAMRPEDGMLLYNVGCIYSLLNCREEAVSTLEKAVKYGVTQKGWYEHDSNLDAVRDHPRFRKLLKRLQ